MIPIFLFDCLFIEGNANTIIKAKFVNTKDLYTSFSPQAYEAKENVGEFTSCRGDYVWSSGGTCST